MAFQVMHPQHRFAECSSQGASHTGTHQQCSGQTRPLGEGHHIHLRQLPTRCCERLDCQWQDAANMIATGEFRHHPAIGLMHFNLAVQGLSEQHGQV